MKRRPPLQDSSKLVSKPASRQSKKPDLVTFNEATLLLHCHRVTLLRLVERGQLHLLKAGPRWMFEQSELESVSNRTIASYPHLTVAKSRARAPRH